MTKKSWAKALLVAAIITMSSFVFAATNDFTADGNVTITGVTFGLTTADLLILSGSTAESFSFDSGAFTVTNPGTFQVGSSDATVKTLRFTQGSSVVACAINTTPGTSYATAPTTAGTYTVEPSALTTCQDQCSAISNAATLNAYPTCGAATCNSGYTLSGSGASATCVAAPRSGGNVVQPPAITLPPTTPIISPPAINLPTFPVGLAVFTRPLYTNSQGNDVRNLQRFLNSDPDTRIALTGVGSPGNETDFFGGLTKAALGKFQLKYGLITSPNDPAFGYLGPKTRAKIAELAATQTGPITPVTPVISTTNSGQFQILQQQLLQLLQTRMMGR